MITKQERRKMRGFADRCVRRYMSFRPLADESEVGAHISQELKKEYGVSPAMLLVIAEIILEIVKAWREARK